jgi:vacuolar-type H+-ATPase subunit I/STV1
VNNAGFLSTQNVRENQLANLSKQIDEKEKEIERLNNIIEDFEIELQREVDVKEEDTELEHNTFITINNTLKTVLKRFRELKGADKE